MRKRKIKQKSSLQISPVKKRFFIAMTLLIPVFFLIFLEAALRIFNYGGDTRLFVSTPNETSKYYGINRNVGRRYFNENSFIPSPRKDLFLKEKPKNGYRIFVLGGSTTAGFPYGNNLTFTRILNRRLSDTFPNRCIEVVNTAMTAINSYTLLDFMDEIIQQQPDAILIYAGHNEFYGALGMASQESLGKNRGIVKAYLKLQRFKTFMLLRDAVGLIQKRINRKNSLDDENDPMQTVMTRIVNKDLKIIHGSTLYRLGEKQFKNNLHDIFMKAKKAGIPVIVSELVSNVRDHFPFASVEMDTLPSARTMFIQAKRFEKEKKYDQARKSYYRAKDLDVLPFRAPEEFNQIIHTLVDEFSIPVVPMRSRFETASPNGLIGNNLICEHLHPNIDGYFLMADAFYNTMRENRLIASNWPDRSAESSSYYRHHWGFTRLDSVYAALNIAHLKGGWPFKKTGPNLAVYQYVPTSKADSIALSILKTGESTLELGHLELARYDERLGEFEKAFQEYKALIYIVPNLDLFYEPAVKFLISREQYGRALQMLTEGLKYNDSFFMLKWIGQLNLVLNDTQKGIGFLEKARQLKQDDVQLLFNLARAYYNISRLKEGDVVVLDLEKIAPGSPLVAQIESFRKTLGSP